MSTQTSEEQARLFVDRLLEAGLEVVETSCISALEHENATLKAQVESRNGLLDQYNADNETLNKRIERLKSTNKTLLEALEKAKFGTGQV